MAGEDLFGGLDLGGLDLGGLDLGGLDLGGMENLGALATEAGGLFPSLGTGAGWTLPDVGPAPTLTTDLPGAVTEGLTSGHVPTGTPGTPTPGPGSTFGDLAKAAIPVAQLGTAALGAATGARASQQSADQAKSQLQSQALQRQAGQSAMGLATELEPYGKTQLQRAEAGTITPASQAKIDAWKDATKAEMRSYLEHSGQGDSETIKKMEAWVDQQGLAMAEQLIQNEAQLGLQAFDQARGDLGVASASSGAATTSAANEQTMLNSMIASLNQQIGKLAA